MATITATVQRVKDGGVFDCYLATWAGMGNADDGTPVRMAGASDRAVQIEGTFGGATVAMQGSMDGTLWQPLTDPQGNAISTTAAKLEQISELTRYIRPLTSGGVGTNITVRLLLKGQR